MTAEVDRLKGWLFEYVGDGVHCVGCGELVGHKEMLFTPNAVPVCSTGCGVAAESWLYPIAEPDELLDEHKER